jgi:amino acid permease
MNLNISLGSARKRHKGRHQETKMRFEKQVLARRFTMICLLAMIFAFGFAALIDSAARPAGALEMGKLQTCPLKNGKFCAVRQ